MGWVGVADGREDEHADRDRDRDREWEWESSERMRGIETSGGYRALQRRVRKGSRAVRRRSQEGIAQRFTRKGGIGTPEHHTDLTLRSIGL
jgi:hypothetical protein